MKDKLEEKSKGMKLPKTAYELSECQVTTPEKVVSLYWDIVGTHRRQFNRVLDMGAGDARFSKDGLFRKYDGVEIDSSKTKGIEETKNIHIFNKCAFKHKTSGYDACIGNPPYVRHHDLETKWKFSIGKRIKSELGINLNLHCNLYLYFMCLGMLKSNSKGLIALVIPFEWVSRPSAEPIRNFINKKKWNVSVYEFKESIFPKVLTTASISIIDKNSKQGKWSFYSIGTRHGITSRSGITESGSEILSYSERGDVWARRGMSPGTQKVFTLTETERKDAKLKEIRDVIPCVTSLKNLPRSVKKLGRREFKKYFVKSGKRCWLIKSTDKKISKRLREYLKSVPLKKRNTYTCKNQRPWYSYEDLSLPDFLFHSGFVKKGPKVLLNKIKAQAVGSVYGISADRKVADKKLVDFLLKYDFENKIVPHSNSLKKIEVKQVNNVLQEWTESRKPIELTN